MIELAGLDDLAVDRELVPCARKHGLFDRLLRDEAENAHGLGLTNTMRTILSLQICVRVPIRVETANQTDQYKQSKHHEEDSHDDCVRRLQIQPQATCARRQQKDLVRRVRRIEHLHITASLVRLGASVESEELPAHEAHKVSHDVHHAGHLEEDEDAMARSEEFGQDAVEELDFARGANDLVGDGAGWVDLLLDFFEEVGVLADLAQLHQRVVETLQTELFAVNFASAI